MISRKPLNARAEGNVKGIIGGKKTLVEGWRNFVYVEATMFTFESFLHWCLDAGGWQVCILWYRVRIFILALVIISFVSCLFININFDVFSHLVCSRCFCVWEKLSGFRFKGIKSDLDMHTYFAFELYIFCIRDNVCWIVFSWKVFRLWSAYLIIIGWLRCLKIRAWFYWKIL